MPDIDPRIETFRIHFDVFDTAAYGGGRDGRVGREDIEAVANGSQYSAEQRAAAQYLLDNPQEYVRLDTANQGGGLYTADGDIAREDVDAFFADAPLYSDSSAFVSDGSLIPEGVERDFEDPVGAAAQTESVALEGEASGASQFMHFVREHQDDSAWLQAYFRALGSEQTAGYLSHVADPSRYDGVPAQFASEEIAAARTALQSMYESGALNDADIARMVEHWAMQRGDFNTGIAQLFGGLQGPRALEMQNAFFRATTELALAGEPLSNRRFAFSEDAGGRLSPGDRESLAAAGAYVLGSTNWENSNLQLINLHNDGAVANGSNAAIDRFITLAMANPTRLASFDAYTIDADLALADPDLPPPGQEVEYDGVAELVEALSHDTTYRGGPDRYLPPPPYSFGALQSVRDQVFYSASNGLDAYRGDWQGNTQLKDGLSRIFMADYDLMLADAVTHNGARLDDDHPFPEALENFAQNVLFTEPSGALRDRTSQFLVDRLSTAINDVNTLGDAEFLDKYGVNQAQMSHLVGSVLGHIDNGMEQAVQVASDTYAAQKDALEFVLGLAWALGQDGLKLLPGGSVVSAILPDDVTDSASYGQITEQIESLMRQGLVDQAAASLLENQPDLVADVALGGLARELSEIVEVGNERDFLASLLSSYNDVDDHPAAGN